MTPCIPNKFKHQRTFSEGTARLPRQPISRPLHPGVSKCGEPGEYCLPLSASGYIIRLYFQLDDNCCAAGGYGSGAWWDWEAFAFRTSKKYGIERPSRAQFPFCRDGITAISEFIVILRNFRGSRLGPATATAVRRSAKAIPAFKRGHRGGRVLKAEGALRAFRAG